MTTRTDNPTGLRKTVNRLARKNSVLETQVDRLTRLLLMARVKEMDVDFTEALDLSDNYRPDFDPDDLSGYDLRFSAPAVDSWLAARRDAS